jgi:prevent-host-death family protein
MRRVPVRELNQHTADVLALVERGERIEITRNGHRVAVIEPAQPDPLGGLIEATAPSGPGDAATVRRR